MTDIKTPNAAQISRTLGANDFTKGTRGVHGYTVTRESGGQIDYNLNQSIGARFPVVLVNLPDADVDRAAEVLTAKGYAAEIRTMGTRSVMGATVRTYRAIVVVSPEELADRAAREERAANADKLADEMVPATARVRVRLTTFPDHARRETTVTRAKAVADTANLLRNPSTDILDDDAVMRELEYRREDGVIGFYVRAGGKRGNLLLFPVPGDADGAPAAVVVAPAPEPIAEGTVIPAGHSLGAARQHCDNPDVVAAIAVLTAAGHTPALLSGEYDDDDVETARGTGFMIDPRGNGRMNIHHLVDGANCTPERGTWPAVKRYRRLFADTDGWGAPSMPGRTAMVVRMYAEDSPTPAEVRAAAAPSVEAIVATVKTSDRIATIMDYVISGDEIGRAIAHYAYGMNDDEINAVDWHAVRAALLDLPSLEGHRVTLHADNRPSGKVTVQLWEKGHGVPAYSEETWNRTPEAYRAIAGGMIRARRAALAERAAREALDDATLYEVITDKGGIPQGAPERLTGAAVRAMFRRDREAAGEERPGFGPHLEITRDGAMWRSVRTVLGPQGHRDASQCWARRVVPAVVADAGQLIMRAGYSLLAPVEKPSVRAFGPWVRPVPGHDDRVIVAPVANGWHKRPDGNISSSAAARWEEETDDYASILRANGWTEVEATDDGIIFTTQPF
ncbi:hypothetical protein ACWGQT_07330 [Streptomyces yangpuensis]